MDMFRDKTITPVGRVQDDHRRTQDGPDPNGSLNAVGERERGCRHDQQRRERAGHTKPRRLPPSATPKPGTRPTGRLRENPSLCRAGGRGRNSRSYTVGNIMIMVYRPLSMARIGFYGALRTGWLEDGQDGALLLPAHGQNPTQAVLANRRRVRP